MAKALFTRYTNLLFDAVEQVVLPAAEHAIYLELEHHLLALDMHIKRAKNSESDREKRLNKVLGQSK